MKKSKKIIRIIIIIIAVYISFILCRGIYWYCKMDGMNVPIIVSTQYSEVPTDIEVLIDDKTVFKDDSLQILYVRAEDLHVSCGIHKLKVLVDDEEFTEYFLVFPVRWIYIEVQKYEPNYKADPNWFYIDFTSTPTVLM